MSKVFDSLNDAKMYVIKNRNEVVFIKRTIYDKKTGARVWAGETQEYSFDFLLAGHGFDGAHKAGLGPEYKEYLYRSGAISAPYSTYEKGVLNAGQ